MDTDKTTHLIAILFLVEIFVKLEYIPKSTPVAA
jgi:hypothetical protein